MNKKELDEFLRLHELWLGWQEGGARAELTKADLRGADLSPAKEMKE